MTRLIPVLAALMITTAPAMADRVSVLVFDASGSMWNRVEGDLTRIEVARNVMGEYFGARDGAVPLSVNAYGHNRRGDCRDIEVIAPMGQTDAGAELADALQQISAAAPPPPLPPVAEPDTPALFAQNFVFRDIGAGSPRGLMEWRAQAADGTVQDLGTTEGVQQSLQGVSVEMPLGDWLIVAEGAEGRAERQMSLTRCCGSHGIPFTGADMAAVILPLGQVQAGLGARLPYEITHPGVGNLGGTPYQIIATGPEGILTANQILRDDLITRRAPGIQGARTGELAPGTYRFMIVVARNGRYDIKAERRFEAVANPTIRVVAPDRALPGGRVEVRFEGGYATRHHVTVVDGNGRDVGQGNSLNRGPGGGSGGPVTMNIVMPNREGLLDIVVRPSDSPADRGTVLARQRITISATPTPAQGQDAPPSVTATFRLPPDVPQSDVTWAYVTWSAQPLDPDMTSGPMAQLGTGPAVTSSFEPGNWRVTATAPGEVTLSADVAIFPGQPNDFTVKIVASGDADHGALDLQGPLRILTAPAPMP